MYHKKNLAAIDINPHGHPYTAHTQEKNEDEDDETPVVTTMRWRGAEVYATS